MKKIEEFLFIFIIFFLLLFFLKDYSTSIIQPLVSLQDITWKHRAIESVTQAILILAVIVGIFSLERR